MSDRPARDLTLLDEIDAIPVEPLEGSVWRVTREDRDPTLGYSSGGRWDIGSFDVLYTSLEPDGAVAEIYYHLSRQPVFPSRIRYRLYKLQVRLKKVKFFNAVEDLIPLGVDISRYQELFYSRCQEIGDAANFLGADGIVVPNARWPCRNLVVFTDHISPVEIEIVEQADIDWRDWRKRMTQRD